MDYEKMAEELLELCGGGKNITSVTHCATRLRLFILDKSQVRQEEIRQKKGVLGIIYSGDELQIVLGKNLIPVYNAVTKLHQPEEGQGGKPEKKKEVRTGKEKIKDGFNRVIGFVSAGVTPMIPGLVGGGMLKVFLLLITLAWAPFEDTSTYTLLSMLADVPFYFMPVFVAYGGAKKLGGTPIFAMVAAAGLVYPEFVALLAGEETVSILNIPVMSVKYSSTLLPALLIAVCAFWCEKLLVKILPGIVRPILLGVGTMVITYTLGVTILGPLGDM